VTSFPLFTSIRPPARADELSYLRNCIDSWRVAGFDAVAVNGPTEIEARLEIAQNKAALPSEEGK